jgi:hypothetical protein
MVLSYTRGLMGGSSIRIAILLFGSSCSLIFDSIAIDAGSVTDASDGPMDSSSDVVDGSIADAAPDAESGDAVGNDCEVLFGGQPDVELVCGGGALPGTCLVAFSPLEYRTCDDLCSAAGSPPPDPCANSYRTGLFTCDVDGFHGCALLSTDSLPPLCECNRP